MDAARQTYRRVADRRDQDALITEHLPLVRQLLAGILRGLPARIDRENLEAAGVLGLVEAARQFDPARGVRFANFAASRIRGAIYDELRRNCPLPQAVMRQWRLIQRAYAQITGTATPEALAAVTGLTVAEVEDCLQGVRMARAERWHDELAEQIPAPTDTAERERDAAEALRLATTLIEQLPEQQRIVITLYYRDGLRLKEIAEVLQLSESRISRILTRAELWLRQQFDRRIAS